MYLEKHALAPPQCDSLGEIWVASHKDLSHGGMTDFATENENVEDIGKL